MKRLTLIFIFKLLFFSIYAEEPNETIHPKFRTKGDIINSIDINYSRNFSGGLGQLLGLNYSLGYFLTNDLSLGVGVGFENDLGKNRSFSGKGKNFMPLFLDTRFYFLNGKPTPFIQLRTGYLVAFGRTTIFNTNITTYSYQIINVGGFLFNPALGFNLPGNKAAFNLTFGYRLQQYGEKIKEFNQPAFRRFSNFIDFKFGVNF